MQGLCKVVYSVLSVSRAEVVETRRTVVGKKIWEGCKEGFSFSETPAEWILNPAFSLFSSGNCTEARVIYKRPPTQFSEPRRWEIH